MALQPGTRLGPYEILSALGAGGMGEVYRARDAKLNRDVALKILPDAFAGDADRLARFTREAQTLAALNHTNIAQIFGLEEGPAKAGPHIRALVMELVDGEDLSQRIARGAIPLDEALPIARQIAEALEAAHEQGIVHRDLKPANIKVRPDGAVKVLDFGLAKAIEAGGAGSAGGPAFAPGSASAGQGGLSMSPTLTSPALMTGVGMILGTAAYMAPEQAKGKPADKRSDVWAFGCVLYEMLTGRRAFDPSAGSGSPRATSRGEGDSIAETLALILMKDPDWTALPASTPTSLRTLIVSCLEKDRRKRAGDIAVALLLLDDRHSTMAGAAPEATMAAGSRRAGLVRLVAVGAVALAVGAGVTALAVRFGARPTSPSVTRMAIALGDGEQMTGSTDDQPLALSPDGRSLVFVAGDQLYLRTLDSFSTRMLPGTSGATAPFFSPDGEWVGFFAGNKLQKVSVHGGTPLVLCGSVGTPNSASWAPGFIVFSPASGVTGLFRVPDTGGDRVPLPRPSNTSQDRYLWPQVLPGGTEVMFTLANGPSRRLAVQSLTAAEHRIVMEGAAQGRYVADGHLVYLNAGTLMAVGFDVSRSQVRGAPVPVVEGLRYTTDGAGLFTTSSSGTLLYVPGALEQRASLLAWVDRHGQAMPLAAPPRNYTQFSLSPDGTRVAFDLANGASSDIWTYDIARNSSTRLTFAGFNRFPIWSPDGTRVAYYAANNGPENAYERKADGSGAEELLTHCTGGAEGGGCVPDSWSPDGTRLLYHQLTNSRSADMWVLTRRDGKAVPLLQTPALEEQGRVSPNGRWLIYTSNESGRNEIYAQSFAGQAGKWQISTEGGMEPLWAPSGREIFYRDGNKMMAVGVTTEPTFTVVGTPQALFEARFVPPSIPIGTSAVGPDGQRFLMLQPISQTRPVGQINAVLNWTAELNAKVP